MHGSKACMYCVCVPLSTDVPQLNLFRPNVKHTDNGQQIITNYKYVPKMLLTVAIKSAHQFMMLSWSEISYIT